MFGRRMTTIITHDMLYNNADYMRVKTCGMFCEEDIAAVNIAMPDMCGFLVNWPSSYRHVDRDALFRLISNLDPAIPAVGVFIDQPIGYVAELADEMLDVVQLNGTEGNPYITFLRELVDIPIIQTIRLRSSEDVERANRSKADMVLLEGGAGAEGDVDWSLIQGVARPYILAGGLTPDNVAASIDALRPRPWGVDLNAGLELNGKKDPDKIIAAVRAAKGAVS